MSATDWFCRKPPEFLDGAPRADSDGPAISALLECSEALNVARFNIQVVKKEHSSSLFDDILRSKLEKINFLLTTQEGALILDKHLADLELARKRAQSRPLSSFELESQFLSLEPHRSNTSFDSYLEDYSVQLWNILVPNHLPNSLVHAILTPAIKSLVNLLSRPWVVHLMIITTYRESLVSRYSPHAVRKLQLLAKTSANDFNPFIRNFFYRLASRSKMFRVLRIVLWPADPLVSLLVNRMIGNYLALDRPYNSKLSESMLVAARDWLFLHSDQEPDPKERAQNRLEAMEMMPKVFGTPVVPTDTFDYFLINRRLIVSFLDLTLEVLRTGE